MPAPEKDAENVLKIRYDAEWLAILKESERFMNYSREHWNIPASFYEINSELRQNFAATLEGDAGIIDCPIVFRGNEVNQTKILRSKFLTESPQNCSKEANPEEIELDM